MYFLSLCIKTCPRSRHYQRSKSRHKHATQGLHNIWCLSSCTKQVGKTTSGEVWDALCSQHRQKMGLSSKGQIHLAS